MSKTFTITTDEADRLWTMDDQLAFVKKPVIVALRCKRVIMELEPGQSITSDELASHPTVMGDRTKAYNASYIRQVLGEFIAKGWGLHSAKEGYSYTEKAETPEPATVNA